MLKITGLGGWVGHESALLAKIPTILKIRRWVKIYILTSHVCKDSVFNSVSRISRFGRSNWLDNIWSCWITFLGVGWDISTSPNMSYVDCWDELELVLCWEGGGAMQLVPSKSWTEVSNTLCCVVVVVVVAGSIMLSSKEMRVSSEGWEFPHFCSCKHLVRRCISRSFSTKPWWISDNFFNGLQILSRV